jgi:hypothetical protein
MKPRSATEAFERLAVAQAWSSASQIDLIRRAINAHQLQAQLDLYACARAFYENDQPGHFNAAKDGNRKFERVAVEQGWNEDSELTVLYSFIEDLGLASELLKLATEVAAFENESSQKRRGLVKPAA